jgi:hypothetical protein
LPVKNRQKPKSDFSCFSRIATSSLGVIHAAEAVEQRVGKQNVLTRNFLTANEKKA